MAAITATIAAPTRPRVGRSMARSPSQTAVSATVSPIPFFTNSIVMYVEPALWVASTAASSPAPALPPSRRPTPYAGTPTSAPSTAAPSFAPASGPAIAANGASR